MTRSTSLSWISLQQNMRCNFVIETNLSLVDILRRVYLFGVKNAVFVCGSVGTRLIVSLGKVSSDERLKM